MSPVRTSKFLSLVLRHDPGKIGITLDDAGWTDVSALIAACAAHGVTITRDELADIVASSDKQRFALSPDGMRIRANQGHSVEVDLDLPPAMPPARLYHGTVADVLAAIRADGLTKRARHHVHMSADPETATRVGGRRGKAVILVVRAEDMVAAGHVFFRSANGVWLTDHVPPGFIEFPAAPRGAGGGSRAKRIMIAEQTLAACDSGRYVNAAHQIVELGPAIERAVKGTFLFEAASVERQLEKLPLPSRRMRKQVVQTQISVTGESTVAAIQRLAGMGTAGHLACLNFASAKHPGGGFLDGAQAQEESLARSSALYPCLLAMPEHYARNRLARSAHYLDLAIYSHQVPFIRDDDGGWLDAPVPCSVITCAAPNAAALRQHGRFDAAEVEVTLRRRAGIVLQIANSTGVDSLVLGAWGAGVFGNDPAMVARVFRDLLATEYADWFAQVVFAVLGGAGTPNHDAFASVFAAPSELVR